MPLLMEFTAKLSSYHRLKPQIRKIPKKSNKSPGNQGLRKTPGTQLSFSASIAPKQDCQDLPDPSGLERTLALSEEVLGNGAGQTARSVLQNGVERSNHRPLK